MATTSIAKSKPRRRTSGGDYNTILRSPAAARLFVEEEWYGQMRFSGTKADLVAAGLALATDFPGDPVCRCITSHTFWRDGRRCSILIRSRAASPLTYWLFVGRSPQELNAERDAEAMADAAEQRAKATEASRVLRERMAKVAHGTPDLFRQHAAALIRMTVDDLIRPAMAQYTPTGRLGDIFPIICGVYRSQVVGYRLDLDTLRAFDDAVADLMQVVLTGGVVSDPASSEAELTRLRAELVKADPHENKFREFLQRAGANRRPSRRTHA